MALKNPQSSFEDGIFGPNGSHPAPKTLPYPTQPLSTLYGDTVEYLIPEGQKERILKKLYPFGEPPAMTQTLMDIHENKAFVVKDFKVVQQGDYVLLASPYFASSGGSVVDWEPLNNEDGVHVEAMPDELQISAFAAGEADALTGWPFGSSRPAKGEGMSKDRYRMIEEAYAAGFASGEEKRTASNPFFSDDSSQMPSSRRSFRRP